MHQSTTYTINLNMTSMENDKKELGCRESLISMAAAFIILGLLSFDMSSMGTAEYIRLGIAILIAIATIYWQIYMTSDDV